MKLKDLTKEDLESLGYDDIAYIILSESKAKLKLSDIFKKICDLLDLSEAEYEAKIGDFFQMMSTDKRFIMLEKGNWDLKSRHQTTIIMDEEEEEEIEEETIDDTDIIEPDEEDEDDNFYDEDDTEQDDPDDDDLKDLVIVSDMEDDEANANM